MKMTPALKKAQSNMESGILSVEGFLGSDKRPLSEIITEDEEKMALTSVSFEKCANRMHYLMEEGRKGLGEPVTVSGTWLVKTDDARGKIACPFEDGIAAKVNVEVQKIDNERVIYYTDLSIHLLEHHHFLQGKGSSFRLEPEVLADILF